MASLAAYFKLTPFLCSACGKHVSSWSAISVSNKSLTPRHRSSTFFHLPASNAPLGSNTLCTPANGQSSSRAARANKSPSSNERTVSVVTGSAKRTHDALLVDVGGTLLQTAKPVPETYAAIGQKYGVSATPADIKKGFKEAFSRPWTEPLRYEGDGRLFWRYAVELATGCGDPAFFEELYQHYAEAAAWQVAPGALEALAELRQAGVKLAVVSNFDTRLRPLLEELGALKCFDAVIVSAEVGYEKPAPEVFRAALLQMGIEQSGRAVHVGDDPVADVDGARAVGMTAWLWKKDVQSFAEIVTRVLAKPAVELAPK